MLLALELLHVLFVLLNCLYFLVDLLVQLKSFGLALALVLLHVFLVHLIRVLCDALRDLCLLLQFFFPPLLVAVQLGN